MNCRPHPRATLRLLAISGILALAGSPLAAQDPAADSTADAGASLRDDERTFLEGAARSGRTAAELSRLAVSQATGSTVRDFAQQLVSDYGQINRTLEALARRKALALPPEPTSFSDAYKGLAGQAGAGFDRAYVRRTTQLCRRILQLCESAVASARDPDVRDLAGSLLPTLRGQVNRATELEKSL